MNYLDFPPLAEFTDRHSIVRPIYGTTIFGRYAFADRLADIEQMLNEAPEFVTWESLYISQPRFRHAIDKALECWGIDPDWLTPQHIEQLLFMRGDEPGWLIELSKGKENQKRQGQTLSEVLASISTHCQSLQEALELANNVPADLLTDTLNARAGMMNDGEKLKNPQQQQKERYLKDNFDELMARF